MAREDLKGRPGDSIGGSISGDAGGDAGSDAAGEAGFRDRLRREFQLARSSGLAADLKRSECLRLLPEFLRSLESAFASEGILEVIHEYAQELWRRSWQARGGDLDLYRVRLRMLEALAELLESRGGDSSAVDGALRLFDAVSRNLPASAHIHTPRLSGGPAAEFARTLAKRDRIVEQIEAMIAAAL